MINSKKKTIIRPRKNKPLNKNMKNMKNITNKKSKTKKNVESENKASNSNSISKNNSNRKPHSQDGGALVNKIYANVNKRDNFQVTTLRSINQNDYDRFKISNYVNNNVEWGSMPGPPPTDCVIM
jgi:hypothetical protein